MIERFSEDIDLALSRESIGYSGELLRRKIEELREVAFSFISNELKNEIEQVLIKMGIPADLFKIVAAPSEINKDPQTLQLQCQSILTPLQYIPDRVLIEVSARSLRDPFSQRDIISFIGANPIPDIYTEIPFLVNTVEPRRTFLEKAFLLHEEFSKPAEKIRHDRMSRHLYDIYKIMDTEHSKAALEDTEMYKSIIEHRKKFNKITGIDYSQHSHATINFIPPDDVLKEWKTTMQL